MKSINSSLSSRLFHHNQRFKEIKKLEGNKVSQQNYILMKMINENFDITLVLWIATSITPYLTLSFQVN